MKGLDKRIFAPAMLMLTMIFGQENQATFSESDLAFQRIIPFDKLALIASQDAYINTKVGQFRLISSLGPIIAPFVISTIASTIQEPDFSDVKDIQEVYLAVDPSGLVTIVKVAGFNALGEPISRAGMYMVSPDGLSYGFRDAIYPPDMFYLPEGWTNLRSTSEESSTILSIRGNLLRIVREGDESGITLFKFEGDRKVLDIWINDWDPKYFFEL